MKKNFLVLLCSGLALLQNAAAQSQQPSASPTSSPAADEVAALVRSQTFVRNSPNADGQFQNADLMGNGDLLVSTKGTPDAYVFNVCKNDFWQSHPVMKNPVERATPLRAGEIRFSIPSLAGATYRQEQDIYLAEVRGIFAKGENRIQIVSRVTATAGNYLVVEIQNQGAGPCPVVMETVAPHMDYGGGAVTTESAGVHEPDQIAWVERGTPAYASAAFVMRSAMASKIFGAPCTNTLAGSTVSSTFTVPAGGTVTAVIAVHVTGNQMPLTRTPDDPVPGALGLLTGATEQAVAEWNAAHREWWSAYWKKSYIHIPGQPLLEKYYYAALYILASSNRDGKAPAGLWGWNGTDDPYWCGDYHTNYNIQAVYYGVYSSNRPELAGGFYQAINDYALNTGKVFAASRIGCTGTWIETGIGPFGITAVGTDYGMKTDAVECAILYLKHYDYTHDTAWADRTAYPFLRLVADFWDQYLEWEPAGNRYVIKKSSVAEGDPMNFNATSAIAFLRCFYKGLLEISHDLNKDSDRRAKWENIMAHLPAYPVIDYKGKKVFAFSEGGGAEGNPYPYNLYPVFPTEQVGLDDPLAQVGRDTIATRDYWNQPNSFCEIYPAAVQCGYDPGTILAKMNALLAGLRPNGDFFQRGGGIETVGTIEAIDCMLLQSTEGTLKFFPVWDGSDARFVSLRAVGAFLISAELKGGTVQNITLTSEKGRSCRVKNPWPGHSLAVHQLGGSDVATTHEGDIWSFETAVGAQYTLQPK